MPPLQQPPGQVIPSHAQVPVPVSHRPFAQTAQAAPTAPHSLADCEEYGTQVLPLQHPFGHDVASQAQLPDSQACPVAHALQAEPAVPQELADCEA